METMRCKTCGRFIGYNSGWSWALTFSLFELDCEIFRCEKCTDEYGIIQSNAKPYDDDMSQYQGINLNYAP